MKIFYTMVHSALLVSTPALVAYPANEIPRLQQVNYNPMHIPDLRTLSYDEVVELLSEIESDSFEERYSADELDQINQFVSLLAMEGASEDEKPEMARDIASLLRSDAIQYALLPDARFDCAHPAIYIENAPHFVLCKSWFKKQWDQTRSFVKKHKKAIIVGAIVAVTVAVVVVAAVSISSAAATAAAATGGALAPADNPKAMHDNPSERNQMDAPQPKEMPYETVTSSLQSQLSAFKETVAKEQFESVSESNGISIEDNGRIVGSLFAHQVVDSVTARLQHNPSYASELKDFGQYPVPRWFQSDANSSAIMPHSSADLAFSTEYAASYPRNFSDLNAFAYQARGDLALSSQCYTQAVQDFGKAISLDPANPILYLERGIAHFELGNYEQSIHDYNQFVEKKGEPFSVTDFSLGFAKGVPKGAYESGKGALLFLSEFVAHPVQTSKQVIGSISQLAALVKNDQFGVIAETLSPELHQLVTEWDALPAETRGELAGYAVGKLGTDFLAPGAVAKVANKSVNIAKELAAVCKNLQIAQETLVLETAAGIGIPVKVAEIVEMGKKTVALGEEFGFTAQEITQLQKAGKLEGAINTRLDRLVSQSESEVFKAAISRDSHVKMVRDYLNKPAKEIQKGIKSYEKQIALHKEKIANPSKFIPHWDELHPERQNALIHKKWPAEIQCYSEQRDVLQSILNERLN